MASVVALVMIGRAASMFLENRSSEAAVVDPEPASGSSVVDVAKSFLPGQQEASQGPLTKGEYLAARAPRLDNVPSSAPVYDQLTEPQSFPRLYCMASHDPNTYAREFTRMASAVVNGRETVCQCYTQQGTRVATDFAFCFNAVQNGYFDPTLPDRSTQQAYQQQPQQQPQQLQQAPNPDFRPDQQAPVQQPGLTVVSYERGKFLW